MNRVRYGSGMVTIFEWGVRFGDGSVMHPWNGSTARQRAEEELARSRARVKAWYDEHRSGQPVGPQDRFTLVARMRGRGGPWFAFPESFDWGDLGVGEDGLPVHLPMPLTKDGEGPASDDEAHHYGCWCIDSDCLLTEALRQAWEAGRRVSGSGGTAPDARR